MNRFKDKNPSALNNLDFLLQHTHSQVIEIGTQIENLKRDQAIIATALSNSITSNNIVLRTLCNMSDEQWEILNQFISPAVDDDNSEIGWEELTTASTAHLLRTCLSKKEHAANTSTAIESIENTEKLKR